MFEHRDADRVPVIDDLWGATVERWRREGMPAGTTPTEYFELDRVAGIGVDNSPRYEEKTLEESDEFRVYTTRWGAKLKEFRHLAGVPEFLGFTITDPDAWAKAKPRMRPDSDRINWAYLKENYPRWRQEGAWVQAGGWFGFDVTHSWMVGTERVLLALVEEPEWLVDMWTHQLDVLLNLFDQVWDQGYTFDSLRWPDDMGYKLNQFFSLNMYRELLKPIHQRAIDWCHAKGIKAHLHSCGDIRPLVPELVGMGLDALHPLEVKAGMDPVALKRQFGDKLVLHGGVNAVLYDHPEQIRAEIARVVPQLKTHGGYIFSSDHSVPSSVSLEDFRAIIATAKEAGSF